MAQLVLPTGHTDRDRRLAERIAVSLKSDELIVCRLQSARRPAPRRPRPVPPRRPPAAAAALSLLWGAVVALSDRRRAAP
jgi:hypothetical protein